MQGEGSAASKAGVGRLANLGVTLQRRWANVLSDYTRQGVVECFLGLKLKEHFPSVSIATGQLPLPLNESEDDEADLEFAAPGNLKDKVESSLICWCRQTLCKAILRSSFDFEQHQDKQNLRSLQRLINVSKAALLENCRHTSFLSSCRIRCPPNW